MRFADWDGEDGSGPDPERTLGRLRLHHAAGTLPWRCALRATVPSTRPGDLEPWTRAITGFFAALPYRLVDEEVGPDLPGGLDPAGAARLVARITFERIDYEQLMLGLRDRPPTVEDLRLPEQVLRDLHEHAMRGHGLAHVRALVEGDRPPRVYTATTSVPSFLRDTLDAWAAGFKEYFAGHPYRLAEETIADDPARPGKVIARLRFERVEPPEGE